MRRTTSGRSSCWNSKPPKAPPIPAKARSSRTPTGWPVFSPASDLNGAITVAYIPRSIRGHAVLVAIACEKIIMASAATMGDAGADEKTISNTLRAAYEEIAVSRQTRARCGCPGHARQRPRRGQAEDGRQRAVRHCRAVARDREEPPHPFHGNDQAGRRALAFYRAPRPATGASSALWPTTAATCPRQMQLSPDIVAGDPSGGKPWQAIRVESEWPDHSEPRRGRHSADGGRAPQGANFICLSIEQPRRFGAWKANAWPIT